MGVKKKIMKFFIIRDDDHSILKMLHRTLLISIRTDNRLEKKNLKSKYWHRKESDCQLPTDEAKNWEKKL